MGFFVHKKHPQHVSCIFLGSEMPTDVAGLKVPGAFLAREEGVLTQHVV